MRWFFGLALTTALFACGGDDDGSDAGRDGGSPSDAGPRDSGPPRDAGGADSAAPDAGFPPSMFTPLTVREAPPVGVVVSTTHIVPMPADSSRFLVFDAASGTVTRWACGATGCTDEETLLEDRALAPVTGTIVDFDGDDDLDVLVAGIGPNFGGLPGDVGAVEWLRNDGGSWGRVRLLDETNRAVCAEPGDLDGDGDLDVVVCEFGQTTGRLSWLETTDGGPVQHELHARTGTSHARLVDVDADGDLDLMALISQLEENVLLYRNDGTANFSVETVFDYEEPYAGLSDLEPVDYDADGDVDFVLVNGDGVDGLPAGVSPAEVHGVAILENDGSGVFTHHDLIRNWGSYTARPGDVDLDGDLDLVVVNDQDDAMYSGERLPAMWLENTGGFTVVRHPIPEAPARAEALGLGDVDGDGDLDILTGRLFVAPSMPGLPLVLLRNELR